MDADLNKLFRNMSLFKLLRCYSAIANTWGLLDVYVLKELIFNRNLLPKWVKQNEKIVGLPQVWMFYTTNLILDRLLIILTSLLKN